MRMSAEATALESGLSEGGLASRYEALIRLAQAIRSLSDEADLLRTLAKELREVVQFDALCQLDGMGNWVQWYFVEPYTRTLEVRRPDDFPKEESPGWWVYQNQE